VRRLTTWLLSRTARGQGTRGSSLTCRVRVSRSRRSAICVGAEPERGRLAIGAGRGGLERTELRWLAEAIGCEGFTGSLAGGGSSANLIGLAMAREAKAACG
jgi:hypothetical protein